MQSSNLILPYTLHQPNNTNKVPNHNVYTHSSLALILYSIKSRLSILLFSDSDSIINMRIPPVLIIQIDIKPRVVCKCDDDCCSRFS